MITFAGLELEHQLMNAAGTCKTVEDVKKFARSAVSAIVVGSITMEARLGNEGNVYFEQPGFSLNSLGMPNRGASYYRSVLPEMVRTAHAAGKLLGVSVAGFSSEEYGQLVMMCYISGVDFIELNLGCPNVWDGGVQKRITSFDPTGIANVLTVVEHEVPSTFVIGLKLSPYSDPGLLGDAAGVISGYTNVAKYIATANTFPNGLAWAPSGNFAITGSLGGVSGPAMKPIAMGQARQWMTALADPVDMPIIGVGGIASGQDMLDYINLGCTAVQVATAYWNANEDPGVFSRILTQYHDLVE